MKYVIGISFFFVNPLGVPSFRDPVIRSHSTRAQCSVVGIDYRQNQGQEACHSQMGSVTRAARGDKERTAACWKAWKKLWSFHCCQRFNRSLHQQIQQLPSLIAPEVMPALACMTTPKKMRSALFGTLYRIKVAAV